MAFSRVPEGHAGVDVDLHRAVGREVRLSKPELLTRFAANAGVATGPRPRVVRAMVAAAASRLRNEVVVMVHLT
jgi:hypothetical protein